MSDDAAVKPVHPAVSLAVYGGKLVVCDTESPVSLADPRTIHAGVCAKAQNILDRKYDQPGRRLHKSSDYLNARRVKVLRRA